MATKLLSIPVLMALMVLPHSSPVSAQPVVTVQMGVNKSKFGHTAGIVHPRDGITLGASIGIPIRDRFILQYGVAYVPKGEGVDHVELSNAETNHIELSHMALFKVVASSRASSVYMMVGPSMGVKIKDNGQYNYRPIDLSLALGIGTKISLFKAELLYTRSILHSSSWHDRRTEVISLSVGGCFILF